jgi:hypothetical protein
MTNNSENLKADCMISIKDEDFIALASGTVKPQQVQFDLTIIWLILF